jgi:phosphoenolpyruvate carboxykinase (GTP)
VKGGGKAVETPIGLVPAPDALNLDGLELPRHALEALLRVDRDEWSAEIPAIREFFAKFGARLPVEMNRALDDLAQRLGVAAPA